LSSLGVEVEFCTEVISIDADAGRRARCAQKRRSKGDGHGSLRTGRWWWP
jgi:hypothetical protein